MREGYFYNTKTGERRVAASFAELMGSTSGVIRVLEKRLLDTKPNQELSATDYADYFEQEIGALSREKKREKGARKMQAAWRRYQARINLSSRVKAFLAARAVQARWRSFKTAKAVWSVQDRLKASRVLQRQWRRFRMCRAANKVLCGKRTAVINKEGSTNIQRIFRGYYYGRRFVKRLRIRRDGPQNPNEWAVFVRAAKDTQAALSSLRKAEFVCKRGIYEQYRVLKHPKVFFYRQTLTDVYSWDEPQVWGEQARREVRNQTEAATTGYTLAQQNAIVALQRHYRGKQARLQFRNMVKGVHISQTAVDKYLRDPHSIVNMCNYTLHLLCFQHDYDRVRPLVQQCMQKMEEYGPDNTFILYTFAIFLTATGEEDWQVISTLVDRARAADMDGSKYVAAFEGFFRRARTEMGKNPAALFHFGIASMFVMQKYTWAEDVFLKALEHLSMSSELYPRISETFDFMLSELMGQPLVTAAEKYRIYAEQRAQQHWDNEKARTDKLKLLTGVKKLQAIFRRVQVEELIDQFRFRWECVTDENGTRRWLDHDTGQVVDERPPLLETHQERTERLSHAKAKEIQKQKQEKAKQQKKQSEPNQLSNQEQTEVQEVPALTKVHADINDESANEINSASSVPSLKSDIDDEWEEVFDDEHGIPFFHNRKTGETVWERPKRVSKDLVIPEERINASDESSEWEKVFDEATDKMYYYNYVTGESRWDKPRLIVKSLSKLTLGLSDAGNVSTADKVHTSDTDIDTDDLQEGWEEVMDESSQTPYYYNPHTGESRWAKPMRKIINAVKMFQFSEHENSLKHAAGPGVRQDTNQEEILRKDAGEDQEVWEEIVDPESKASYYYNNVTGESKWERPLRITRLISRIAGALHHDGAGGESNKTPSSADITWEQHHDDDGHAYYWNKKTGESRWDKPLSKVRTALMFGSGSSSTNTTDFAAATSMISSPNDVLPDSWEEVQDVDGQVYYYNVEKGTSQYERPTS